MATEDTEARSGAELPSSKQTFLSRRRLSLPSDILSRNSNVKPRILTPINYDSSKNMGHPHIKKGNFMGNHIN